MELKVMFTISRRQSAKWLKHKDCNVAVSPDYNNHRCIWVLCKSEEIAESLLSRLDHRSKSHPQVFSNTGYVLIHFSMKDTEFANALGTRVPE